MIVGIDASRALRAQRTGTERYSLEITRGLLQLPQAQKHLWRLYADRRASPEFFAPHLADLTLETNSQGDGQATLHLEECILPLRRMWTHRALAWEVMQRPPHVLFIPAHVIPFVLPRRRLPPTVVTIHDLGHRYFPHAHTGWQRLYLEVSTMWAVRSAQRLIAVSQATADDLIRFYNVPPPQIAVIHEAAVPLRRPSASEIAAIQQRHGLRRSYALFVGSIQPRKNLKRLILAFTRLCKGGDAAFDLALAGAEGWLNNSIYDAVAQSGLVDRFHFLGYLPDDDLSALLHGARMFCYPSLMEGFGLPVLEAQSAGVPVMTANNSSLPEVAGNAALLVDPENIDAIAEAMLRLSRDEELRQRLIAAGYVNVRRFSWERAARETLAVLEEAQRSAT